MEMWLRLQWIGPLEAAIQSMGISFIPSIMGILKGSWRRMGRSRMRIYWASMKRLRVLQEKSLSLFTDLMT